MEITCGREANKCVNFLQTDGSKTDAGGCGNRRDSRTTTNCLCSTPRSACYCGTNECRSPGTDICGAPRKTFCGSPRIAPEAVLVCRLMHHLMYKVATRCCMDWQHCITWYCAVNYTASQRSRYHSLQFISLSNIHRFWKFFHWHTVWKICSKETLKISHALNASLHYTGRNINVRKLTWSVLTLGLNSRETKSDRQHTLWQKQATITDFIVCDSGSINIKPAVYSNFDMPTATDRAFLCEESVSLWCLSSLLPRVRTVGYYVNFLVCLMSIDFYQWNKCK